MLQSLEETLWADEMLEDPSSGETSLSFPGSLYLACELWENRQLGKLSKTTLAKGLE